MLFALLPLGGGQGWSSTHALQKLGILLSVGEGHVSSSTLLHSREFLCRGLEALRELL